MSSLSVYLTKSCLSPGAIVGSVAECSKIPIEFTSTPSSCLTAAFSLYASLYEVNAPSAPEISFNNIDCEKPSASKSKYAVT